MTFGDRIKWACKERDITLGALAVEMGMSRNTTHAWASGTTPSLDKVVEAARVLKVSPCWLAFGGDKGFSESLDEVVLARSIQFVEETAVSSLPAEKARLVVSFYLLEKSKGTLGLADLLGGAAK